MSRKKARKLLLIVLALVFVGTLAAVGWRLWDYHKGNQAYSEAEALVNLPDLDSFPAPTVPEIHPTPSSPAPSASSAPAESPAPSAGVPAPIDPVSPVTPANPAPSESAPQPSAYVDPYADIWAAMDFAGLRKVNPDVVGWIMIPGTPVCYPLLQGDDNQYYLNHMWHHGIGSVGSIFLECQNAPDLSDFHTLIYGHRMINGSMFSALKNYTTLDYWRSAPSVYITLDEGTFRYDIFAAYEAAVDSLTYQVFFSSEGSMQNFLDSCLERSVIDTGIVPTTQDSVITLSTCTGSGYDTRWVVQAVRRG